MGLTMGLATGTSVFLVKEENSNPFPSTVRTLEVAAGRVLVVTRTYYTNDLPHSSDHSFCSFLVLTTCCGQTDRFTTVPNAGDIACS